MILEGLNMELKVVKMEIPEGSNLVLGQSHFIKTAEDLYEAMAGTAPGAKFGIAFSEASGDCLVRSEGNDLELVEAAKKNSLDLACGHTFVLLMNGAFPINVLILCNFVFHPPAFHSFCGPPPFHQSLQ